MKKLIFAFLMLALLLYGFSVLADEGQGPDLSGEWAEADTQFTRMTVEKNPESGWDIEIVSPLTHDAYIFKATIQYDASLNSYTYDHGTFWDVPITAEENPDLGEPKIAGTAGTFTLEGDEKNLMLKWHEEQNLKTEILFDRLDANLFQNTPALSEQMTVNDMIYSMVADRFSVTELDIGELAVAEGNGMTFYTRVFDAAGVGRLCLMEMDSAFGKMYTATFTPIELDAPIFSCDYMLFGEEQTLLLELYDATIASPDDTGFSFDTLAECKESYADLPRYERDAAWSDELLLPASDFKKGTGIQAELDGYLLDYSETYFDLMKECERCDPETKLAANAVLGRGLIEKGGLAVNSFKGMIGEEATEKLICDYMFRCR